MAGGISRTLGLGFLFGAKDDGATRTTEEISDSMDRMASSSESIGRESIGVQRLGNFIDALNLSQLSRVGNALEGLAERAGALSNEISSTSLESHGAQFAQEYRAATAGLGEYRAEVDTVRGQISSLSFTLGVGGDDMLAYATTVARTGRSIDEFGLSMRDVAGSIQAGILTGEQLGDVMTSLAQGYDLGADGARRVLDTVTALGEQFGVGADAARAMPEILQAVDQAASRFPAISDNVDVAIESITRLGLAQQRRLGGSFQEGVQGAVEVFNQLAGTRREMEGLLVGLGGEFPELAAEIARATGNVEMSFDAIMQDPARFGATIADMFNNMDRNSPAAARLRSVLEQMGPAFMFLVQGGEASQAALQAAMGDAGNAEGAFARMAHGAGGSTRTFAEQMELVEERFRAGLDRMARRHYPNFERNVIRRQTEAFQRLTGIIDNFAANRGPLGATTRAMIALRRGGAMGLTVALQDELGEAFPTLSRRIGEFLPLLDGVGEGLFQVAGQMGPFMIGLSAMGIRLPQIGRLLRLAFNPLTLFAGGIYLLIRYWDRLGPIMRRGTQMFENFGRSVENFSKSIDWDQMGQDLVDGILGAFGALGDLESSPQMTEGARSIAEGFRALFDGVTRIVGGFIRGMWNRIVEWVMEPPDVRGQVQRAGAAAGVAIGGVFGAAMLTPLRGSIINAFRRVFSSLGRFMIGGRGLTGTALRTVLRRIPYIGAIIGVLFDLPDIISSFRTEGIVNGFRTLFSSIVNGLLFGIPRILSGMTGTDITGGIFDFLMDMFNIESIVEYFRSGQILRGIVEAISSLPGIGLVRMLLEHVIGEDTVNAYLDGVVGLLRTWGVEIRDTFMHWLDYVTPLWDEWMATFREIGGVLGELWDDTLLPLLEDIFGFRIDVGGVGEAFEGAEGNVQSFGDMMRRVLDYVMPMVQWLHRTAMPLVVEGVRVLADSIRWVVGALRTLWDVAHGVYPYLSESTASLIEGFQTFMGVVRFLWTRVFRPVFNAIGRHVQTVWRSVIRPVFEALFTVWSAILGRVFSVARRVFNVIRDHITDRIREATRIFNFLRDTWNATLGVLRTGFRLVGASVERYLVHPFVRVGGTLRTMADAVNTTFMRLKLTVLEIFHRIFDSIQTLANNVPFLGDLVRGALSSPREALQSEISRIRPMVTRAEEEARRNRAQREAEEAASQARQQAAMQEFEAAREEWRRSAAVSVAAPVTSRRAQVARPLVPTEEETVRRTRRTASRREATVERERTREVERLARAIEISTFGTEARRQLADSVRAGMGRRSQRRRPAARPTTPGGAEQM